MRRVAVFDLDGTLVDTPGAIVEAFSVVLGAVGAGACDAAAIRATIGLPLERAFATLTRRPAGDAVVARCVERYLELYRERVVPAAARLVFPGVADGLATLQGDGLTLAVATSKLRASADALLEGAGLRDRFALVVGADDVTRPKPDPEMALAVLRHVGVPAGCAVMVGDTTHDLAMASAAGMRSIAVTYGVGDPEALRSAGATRVAGTFGAVVDGVREIVRETGGAQP